ncbi:hypothetical protein LINGRAPRIM_LOCUS2613, partial [Linum grandiflorum]
KNLKTFYLLSPNSFYPLKPFFSSLLLLSSDHQFSHRRNYRRPPSSDRFSAPADLSLTFRTNFQSLSSQYKAASSSTSLNTRKLDEEIEIVARSASTTYLLRPTQQQSTTRNQLVIMEG